MHLRKMAAGPGVAAQINGELVADLAALDVGGSVEGERPGIKAGSNDDRPTLLIGEALRHVQGDLLYHSEERNTYIRYFLVIFGALATGFGNAFIGRLYIFAISASALLAAVCGLFMVMDALHYSRIQTALDAVAKLQDVVANRLDISELRLTKRGFIRRMLMRLRITWLFSPVQALFWIGFVVAIVCICISLEGLSDGVCSAGQGKTASPTDRVDKGLCKPLGPAISWVDGRLSSSPAGRELKSKASTRPDLTEKRAR